MFYTWEVLCFGLSSGNTLMKWLQKLHLKTRGRNKEGLFCQFLFMHYFVIEHYVIHMDLW